MTQSGRYNAPTDMVHAQLCSECYYKYYNKIT